SISKVNAPNLRQLSLRLDENKPKLEVLMRVLNKFPRLEHLDLQLSETFSSFGVDEVARLPVELVCITSLKTLEVSMHQTTISFDFLLCFPFLKRVQILHY